MAEEKERFDNPYRAPSSNLEDQPQEWSSNVVICAENFMLNMVFGRLATMSTFIIAKVMLDLILAGWRAALFGGIITKVAITMVAVCMGTIMLGLATSLVKFQVSRQIRKKKVTKFIEERKKELSKPINRPIAMTSLLMVSYLLIFFSEDMTRNLLPLDLPGVTDSWPSLRTLTLLALPMASPIAYIFVRAGGQRAEMWLLRMSENTD